MRKLFFIGLLFWFAWGFGQACGMDEINAKIIKNNPEILKKTKAFDEFVAKTGSENILKNNKSKYGKINGKSADSPFIIPVVVHVIIPKEYSANQEDQFHNPTDTEISDWIERANSIFATTYGHGYYPDGISNEIGTVMPYKLALAKRNPNCEATNGIIRYDASGNNTYNDYGVLSDDTTNNANNQGITNSQLLQIAPHWNENNYLNIYIVNGFDGLLGKSSKWAGVGAFPEYPDNNYHIRINSTDLLTEWGTLAHEVGHCLGLYHVFQSANNIYEPNACPPFENGKCEFLGDKVCDTQRTISFGNIHDINLIPTNNNINECEGINYDGVQYNIMNYSKSRKKFTIGQRNRAINNFLYYRKSLIESTTANATNMQTYACIPTSFNSTTLVTGVGPTTVKIGTINNSSQPYNQFLLFDHYVDYSGKVCNNYNSAYATDLNVGDNTLQVGFSGANQNIRAWLDYNNNGVFESNELIASEDNITSQFGSNAETLWSANFSIPDTAVKYQPLRLRIKADNGSTNNDACSTVNDGQVEDYMVRIITPLSYTVNLNCAIQNISTLTGAGTYTDGNLVSISATPIQGYRFLYWKENGTIISTQSNYQFEIHSNRSLEAVFLKLFRVTIKIFPNDDMGTVNGSGFYEPGTSIVLAAFPKNSNYFLTWMENGKSVFSNQSFQIDNIDRDYNMVAYFILKNIPSGTLINEQYWIDNDFSNAIINPLNVIGPDYYDKDDNLMLSIVKPGLHTITYRFQDSLGKWSSAITNFFYKTTKITYAEYWFDNDYTNKKIISGVNGDIYTFQNPFLNNLDEKLHTLNFRAQDGTGKWSSTISGYFMLQSQIVGYEYWVNNGYNSKTYINVSPTNILEINQNFNVNNTSTGNNIFYFRAKNNFGKWSSTIATEFNISGTLGVEDGRYRNSITVAPNPFENFFQINCKEQKLKKVFLYDLNGKLIKELNLNNTTNYSYNAENLPTGIYMLVVVSETGKETFKIIKK